MIDYKRENVGERVMAITGDNGVDAIIELDIAANAKLIPQVLRPRGTVVVYGTGATESAVPLFFLLRNAITLKFIYVYELDARGARRCAGRDRRAPLRRARSSPISAQPFRSPRLSPPMKRSNRATR